jgi:menaquinone-dependent protoporphyrinogen oxidase
MPRRSSSASRVLVLYGTTEGHSAKVAAAFADVLVRAGAAVDVIEAGAAKPDPDPGDYAGCAVIASVHAGNYQAAVVDWTHRHARALNERVTVFVSVSLGVLQGDPKVRQDLDAIRQRFLTRTGWAPTLASEVAGALMYSRYNLLERVLMKRIAAQAGGGTDTRRDYEYTDWKVLRAFARRFGARLGLRAAAPRETRAGAARGPRRA